VSFDRGMGRTPIPSRCVCQPQPYCSLRCDTTTLRQTGPRRRGGGASAAVVDHRSHSGKQLGVIAVTNCDYSLGQRAMGEAPDTVQYHAATPSDPERLDNEARGGAGIDFACRAEPDVDGRVTAVKEDLELARQRTFVGRCQIADLHRRRRRVRCYWPQRLVACQQWPFSQHMRNRYRQAEPSQARRGARSPVCGSTGCSWSGRPAISTSCPSRSRRWASAIIGCTSPREPKGASRIFTLGSLCRWLAPRPPQSEWRYQWRGGARSPHAYVAMPYGACRETESARKSPILGEPALDGSEFHRSYSLPLF
jgi:hypothetical protein